MSTDINAQDLIIVQGYIGAVNDAAAASTEMVIDETVVVTEVSSTTLARSRAAGLINLNLPTGMQTVLTATAALNFNLLVAVSQDLTIALTGAADGDPVFLGVPNAAMGADVIYQAWVSAADTVSVRAARTGAAVDPGSGDFTVTIIR